MKHTELTDEEIWKKAREQVLAFQLINRANQKRFGDLKQEIQKLESRDVEKYPATMTKAMETLQEHKQQKKRETKQQNKGQNQNQKNPNKMDDKKIKVSYASISGYQRDTPKAWRSLIKCSASPMSFRAGFIILG